MPPACLGQGFIEQSSVRIEKRRKCVSTGAIDDSQGSASSPTDRNSHVLTPEGTAKFPPCRRKAGSQLTALPRSSRDASRPLEIIHPVLFSTGRADAIQGNGRSRRQTSEKRRWTKVRLVKPLDERRPGLRSGRGRRPSGGRFQRDSPPLSRRRPRRQRRRPRRGWAGMCRFRAERGHSGRR